MKIKASVIGAKLKIENITIAYGSENSVSICFGFANEWADYTQRRAYFRYGQSQSYYVDIDENGNVEIPSIVIAPPRFSVFVEGKTEDGNKTIRTDVATINVVGNLNAEAVPADGTSTVKILPLKKITQNGTYLANDDLADGYGKVVVDISSYPITVVDVGTYYPKDGYLFDSVTLPDIPLTNAFTSIGYDSIPEVFNAWIEHSKELASKWNPSSTSVDLFISDSKLIFAPKIDTSNVTNMDNMFASCNSLISVPLFDTSNVTNMNKMFGVCESLTSVPAFNTSNVTNMSDMFYYCRNLTSVPAFNTSNVTDMSSMFYHCDVLTSVPLFDTSNVTNMSSMFNGCESITSVPLFDTSNVTNMSSMFYYCQNLTSVPLFNTSNVTDMSSMFGACKSLTSVPLFDTSNVTNMSSMFYYCQNLISVPLFDTSNVTNMNKMFGVCESLTSVPAFNTSKVTDMSYMFSYCSSLTSVPAFNTSNVTSMSSMFSYCSSLTSILMKGMKRSFDIKDTKLQHDALVTLLNNLGTANSGATLAMGSSKLALLSDAEKKIATDKGWTLA